MNRGVQAGQLVYCYVRGYSSLCFLSCFVNMDFEFCHCHTGPFGATLLSPSILKLGSCFVLFCIPTTHHQQRYIQTSITNLRRVPIRKPWATDSYVRCVSKLNLKLANPQGMNRVKLFKYDEVSQDV